MSTIQGFGLKRKINWISTVSSIVSPSPMGMEQFQNPLLRQQQQQPQRKQQFRIQSRCHQLASHLFRNNLSLLLILLLTAEHASSLPRISPWRKQHTFLKQQNDVKQQRSQRRRLNSSTITQNQQFRVSDSPTDSYTSFESSPSFRPSPTETITTLHSTSNKPTLAPSQLPITSLDVPSLTQEPSITKTLATPAFNTSVLPSTAENDNNNDEVMKNGSRTGMPTTAATLTAGPSSLPSSNGTLLLIPTVSPAVKIEPSTAPSPIETTTSNPSTEPTLIITQPASDPTAEDLSPIWALIYSRNTIVPSLSDAAPSSASDNKDAEDSEHADELTTPSPSYAPTDIPSSSGPDFSVPTSLNNTDGAAPSTTPSQPPPTRQPSPVPIPSRRPTRRPTRRPNGRPTASPIRTRRPSQESTPRPTRRPVVSPTVSSNSTVIDDPDPTPQPITRRPQSLDPTSQPSLRTFDPSGSPIMPTLPPTQRKPVVSNLTTLEPTMRPVSLPPIWRPTSMLPTLQPISLPISLPTLQPARTNNPTIRSDSKNKGTASKTNSDDEDFEEEGTSEPIPTVAPTAGKSLQQNMDDSTGQHVSQLVSFTIRLRSANGGINIPKLQTALELYLGREMEYANLLNVYLTAEDSFVKVDGESIYFSTIKFLGNATFTETPSKVSYKGRSKFNQNETSVSTDSKGRSSSTSSKTSYYPEPAQLCTEQGYRLLNFVRLQRFLDAFNQNSNETKSEIGEQVVVMQLTLDTDNVSSCGSTSSTGDVTEDEAQSRSSSGGDPTIEKPVANDLRKHFKIILSSGLLFGCAVTLISGALFVIMYRRKKDKKNNQALVVRSPEDGDNISYTSPPIDVNMLWLRPQKVNDNVKTLLAITPDPADNTYHNESEALVPYEEAQRTNRHTRHHQLQVLQHNSPYEIRKRQHPYQNEVQKRQQLCAINSGTSFSEMSKESGLLSLYNFEASSVSSASSSVTSVTPSALENSFTQQELALATTGASGSLYYI